MCNLYSMPRSRAEVARLARAMSDRNHNQPPMAGVYPDYAAPVVLKGEDGARELRDLRWGMPSSKQALFKAATARADKLRAKSKDVFPVCERPDLKPCGKCGQATGADGLCAFCRLLQNTA